MTTFGFKIESARVNKKELGGGTVLDLGVYSVFYSQLVMGQERPEKIVATGHLNDDGNYIFREKKKYIYIYPQIPFPDV